MTSFQASGCMWHPNVEEDEAAASPLLESGVPKDPDPDDYLPIMRAMADIMSDVLEVPEVGPDDDFFAFGGSPKGAVVVARRLEKAIGRSVSTAMLFHASTPRLMNAALEGERQAETSHLVELQPEGDQPPLFCMPDVYGRPMSFITIASRMPRDQPVIGLAVGPCMADLIARPSMDLIAGAYVAAIVRRRPRGPVRIVGYSFGGSFAQEVACRLHDMGRDVSLVLIDAPNRVVRLRPLPLVPLAARALLGSLRRDGVSVTIAGSRRWVRSLASFVVGPGETTMPSWVPSADRDVASASSDAWRSHRPRVFHGRTLMVVCTRHDTFNTFRNLDGMVGWSGLLRGPLRRVVADVAHQEVVRTGYADQLILEIRAFLAHDALVTTMRRSSRRSSAERGSAR